LRSASIVGQLAQHLLGERGRDDRAAAVGRDDRLAQLLAGGALGEVAGRTRLEGAQQRGRLLAGGHEQHADLRMRGAQGVEHAEAVEARHDEVEDEHVRAQRRDELERLVAVAGLADDLDRGIAVQSPDDPLPDEREVIGGDDANLHGRDLAGTALHRTG
jgi:hypothetical protein